MDIRLREIKILIFDTNQLKMGIAYTVREMKMNPDFVIEKHKVMVCLIRI